MRFRRGRAEDTENVCIESYTLTLERLKSGFLFVLGHVDK